MQADVLFHVLERVRSGALRCANSCVLPASHSRLPGASTVGRAQCGAESFETLAHLEQLGDVATSQASDDRAALVAQLDHAVRRPGAGTPRGSCCGRRPAPPSARIRSTAVRVTNRPSRIRVRIASAAYSAALVSGEFFRTRRRALCPPGVIATTFFDVPCVPGSWLFPQYWNCTCSDCHSSGRAITTSAMPETGRSAKPEVK